jgi:hypothetical protein
MNAYRTRTTGVIILIFAALTLLAACSGNKAVGKYFSDDNPGWYRELNADGTFYSKEGDIGFSGTYRVDGEDITYSLGFGLALKARIEGNILIDEDGERWVKEGNVTSLNATMTIDPVSSSIGSGKSVKLTATLRAGQDALRGKKISWTASSGQCSPSSGATDVSGQVITTCHAPDVRLGNLPSRITVSASFGGSELYKANSADADITLKMGTQLLPGRVTPSQINSGGSINVTATLKDENDNPLSGREVMLIVYKDIVDPPSAITDVDGQATFTYTTTMAGTYTMKVFFPGDDMYLETTEGGYAWLVVHPSSAIRIKRVKAGSGCTPNAPGPIETIDIEQGYLPSVVASENGGADVPIEALKAQAVASRTFAHYKMQYESRSASFDMCDTEADQVYSPSIQIRSEIQSAVEGTRNIVAKQSGAVIAAFFVKGDQASGTAAYVTVNEGKTGGQVTPTTLGSPDNRHNRGAMGQDKANELAAQGWDYQRILRYFYGDDIVFAPIRP